MLLYNLKIEGTNACVETIRNNQIIRSTVFKRLLQLSDTFAVKLVKLYKMTKTEKSIG